jgi:hypothetical protein
MLALRTAPLRAVRPAPSPADTFEEHSQYATVEACGPICQDIVFGTAGRNVGSYTLQQLALHGQGTFIDPSSPQQLTLDGLDTSEFPHFCP